MIEQLIGASQRTTDGPANPQPAATMRLILLEIAVKRQRVLHLGRREVQELRNLDDCLPRYVPQLVIDDVQCRQSHRLPRGVSREQGRDGLCHFRSEYFRGCH
jgi:hypothetical protein